MRPQAIIFFSEVFNDHAGFCQCPEQFTVQAFITELTVEAFDKAVLPRAARFDIDGFYFIVLKPLLKLLGDNLRSVVRANVFRCPMLIYKL